MKKNKTMRLAACLLVMVLLTTSMISGTFAKYVTEGSGTDTARVAKFGVSVTANGETFANTYTEEGAAYATVESKDKVVAPGTDGEMVSVKLSGQPEVTVKVSYEGSFDISDNWMVDGVFYCPLVITVNNTPIDGATFSSAEAFEAAVNKAITDYSAEFGPGTDLSAEDVAGAALAISWKWPFSVSTANDAKDTWLGNQAAAGNPATVTLAVKTIVTQVD